MPVHLLWNLVVTAQVFEFMALIQVEVSKVSMFLMN